MRRVGHRFLPTGDDEVCLARADAARGVDYRCQSRQAHFVDSDGGGVPTDAGAERRLPRGVLSRTRLEHLPEDDGVDVAHFNSGSLDCRANRECAQLHGAERGQLPSQFAEGGSCPGKDYDVIVGHDQLLISSAQRLWAPREFHLPL